MSEQSSKLFSSEIRNPPHNVLPVESMAFPLVGGSRREAWKVKSVPLSSILVFVVPSYPNTTSRSCHCLAKICPTTNRGQTHGGFVSKLEDKGRKIKNRDQTPWRRTQCDIWHRSEKPEAQIGNLIPIEGLLNLSPRHSESCFELGWMRLGWEFHCCPAIL